MSRLHPVIIAITFAVLTGTVHADKARDARDAKQKALKSEVSQFFKALARKDKRDVGELFQVINKVCSAPANWYMNCEIVKVRRNEYKVWTFDYGSQKKKSMRLTLDKNMK